MTVLTALLAALTDPSPPPAPVIGPYLTDPHLEGVTIRFETRRNVEAEVRVAKPGEPARSVSSSRGSRHVIRLHGLEPATTYEYRLVLDGAPSDAVHRFRTAPSADEPFSFVVMGDTRSAEADHRAVIQSLAAEAPGFVMNTGDMVNDGGEESGWQSFFRAAGPLLSRAAIFPALGNHESQNQRGLQNFTRFFGIPLVDGEMRYAFTYGNSRFLVLDTNVYFFALTAQTEWLREELRSAVADPKIRHIFAMMHHGPFATGPHGGNKGVRAAWAPLFAAYGVEAVFSGHDHLYERLEKDGVRYVVSGGGGGPLYPQKSNSHWEDENASIYSETVHHYVRVHVAGEQVEMAARRIDGSLIESVRWRLLQRVVRPELIPTPEETQAALSPQAPRAIWIAAIVASLGFVALVAYTWRRRSAVTASRSEGR